MFIRDEYLDAVLIDLLFDTNQTYAAIGTELGMTETEVRRRIRELGLGWVRRSRGFASRGQAALTQIMRKLLPGERVVAEEPLGDRLRLDVYCPRYQLAAEYHGRQHFSFVEHFHGDRYGFEDHQRRDDKKLKICQDLGIALVVFRYTDDLSEDSVFNRLLDAIESTPWQSPEHKSIKGNPYYEAVKQRQREYRRHTYQRMKKRGSRTV